MLYKQFISHCIYTQQWNHCIHLRIIAFLHSQSLNTEYSQLYVDSQKPNVEKEIRFVVTRGRGVGKLEEGGQKDQISS